MKTNNAMNELLREIQYSKKRQQQKRSKQLLFSTTIATPASNHHRHWFVLKLRSVHLIPAHTVVVVFPGTREHLAEY